MKIFIRKLLFVMVMALSVTLAFAACEDKEKYTVKYKASEGGYIQGEQTQEVEKGSDASVVTAVANEGYRFKIWSDGVESAERQDTNIRADKEVTAEFELCFESGEGTTESPYMITEYSHLVNMNLYPNASYKLKNDLDLSGIDFEPIFTKENSFMGKFDGDNKSIINLTINSKSEYPSLFGYIGKDAEVGNLILKNSGITIKDFDTSNEMYAVGALAGVSMGDVHDINVEVAITSSKLLHSNVAIGGLIGYSRFGKNYNCVANITIDISNIEIKNNFYLNVGGFIGNSCSDVADCSVQGHIKTDMISTYMSSVFIGGFIGKFDDSESPQKIEIKNCLVDVQIESSGSQNHGGFIGEVIMHNSEHEVLLNISECTAQGNLIIKDGRAGGFICKVSINENTELRLNSCFSKGDITGGNRTGGFIDLLGNYNQKGRSEITNCHVSGNIFGYLVAGFCAEVRAQRTDERSNIVISGCSFAGSGTGTSVATGFILLASKLDIEKCSSVGEVSAPDKGSGFIFIIRDGKIANCYSTSNVTLTNTDPKAGRTLVGGFISFLSGCSEMSNCYYAGDVKGEVHSQDLIIGEPIVGAFIGNISEDTTITNSYSLHSEKTFAPSLVGENLSYGKIEITAYNNIEEMFFLADVLNNESENIWENVPNATPGFK